MKILELFDTIKKLTWNKEKTVAKFSLSKKDHVKIMFKEDIRNYYAISFERNGKINNTGGGDAFRIFSIVQKAVYEFKTVHKPHGFTFESEQDFSRLKLYEVFSEKLAEKYKWTWDMVELRHTCVFIIGSKSTIEKVLSVYNGEDD